jgi:membrane protein
MKEATRENWRKLRQFLFHDLWDVEVTSLSSLKALVVRLLRVGQLVGRGFREDELTVHAASLTFASLMSLVPLLAIVFSLLKGLGVGEDQIAKFMQWKAQMPLEFQGFIDQMMEIVNTTNFAALGWVGLLFLLFTATMVLSNVESSFNRVWGITTSRNVLRRIANYISILVVVPILIGVAGTVAAAMRSEAVFTRLGSAAIAYRHLLRLTPVFSAWLAFAFLYVFLPNTRVKWGPAAVSALVGALLWLGWQKVYISFQIGVARYNTIYGTFASVPVFLAWLYVSWVIVLLGAEVAFAVQNHGTYHLEQQAEKANLKARSALGLAVILRAAVGLERDVSPFDIAGFARERRVPVRLLNDVVGLFVREQWLAEIADQPGTYALMKAPEQIQARDVVDVVMSEGAPPERLGLDHLAPAVENLLEHLQTGLDEALSGRTVADILQAEKRA